MEDNSWTHVGPALGAWSTAHAARVRSDAAGGLVPNDGEGHDFHLIRVREPRAAFAFLKIELSVLPLPGCTTHFYVNAWGGRDLAVLSADGRVLQQHPSAEAHAERRPDGFIDITVTYLSVHETLNIGTFKGDAVYQGTGADQFLIRRADVFVRPLPSRLGGDKIAFVDVGAEGGYEEKWRPYAADLDVTFVEAAPDTANALRADYPQCRVLEVGLLDRPCARILNITRLTGCSSVLTPDAELLRRWSVAPVFDIMRTVEVRRTPRERLGARSGRNQDRRSGRRVRRAARVRRLAERLSRH